VELNIICRHLQLNTLNVLHFLPVYDSIRKVVTNLLSLSQTSCTVQSVNSQRWTQTYNVLFENCSVVVEFSTRSIFDSHQLSSCHESISGLTLYYYTEVQYLANVCTCLQFGNMTDSQLRLIETKQRYVFNSLLSECGRPIPSAPIGTVSTSHYSSSNVAASQEVLTFAWKIVFAVLIIVIIH
jgi:hypothetical protein